MSSVSSVSVSAPRDDEGELVAVSRGTLAAARPGSEESDVTESSLLCMLSSSFMPSSPGLYGLYGLYGLCDCLRCSMTRACVFVFNLSLASCTASDPWYCRRELLGLVDVRVNSQGGLGGKV